MFSIVCCEIAGVEAIVRGESNPNNNAQMSLCVYLDGHSF